MLAARAYEGEQELRLEEIDRPKPGPGEIVMKVEAAGLPTGVIAQWDRGMYPIMPRTLGNEAAGSIFELGAGLASEPNFLAESQAAPREFLFGTALEADSWEDLRQTARKCFTALAGDTSPFVAINA
jgi:hypothetical protein